MKAKKIKFLLTVLCLMVVLGGCGRISNEKIVIKQYKNLEIEKDTEREPEELVWDILIQNCKVKEYPDDLMEDYAEDIKSQYNEAAAMYDVEVEDFIEQNKGTSLDELVKKRICKKFAIELIAQNEKIVVTDEDYKEGLERFATEYGYEDLQAFEDFVGKDNLKETLLQEKVTKLLVEYSK